MLSVLKLFLLLKVDLTEICVVLLSGKQNLQDCMVIFYPGLWPSIVFLIHFAQKSSSQKFLLYAGVDCEEFKKP